MRVWAIMLLLAAAWGAMAAVIGLPLVWAYVVGFAARTVLYYFEGGTR